MTTAIHVYIGQTKSHYGSDDKEYGLHGRWKKHLADSKSRRDTCPYFHKAIRKHGEQNFYVREVLRCDLDKLDFNETIFIELFDSTNRLYGYNLTIGGKGIVNTSDEIRHKISKSLGNDQLMNIKQYYNGTNSLVGYIAKRRMYGKIYEKCFISEKRTIKQNFELAKKFIDNLKKGILDNNKYNRKDKLPKNISYRKNKHGEPIDYYVGIRIRKHRYFKMISDPKMSMEDKYKLAIEYKNKILNTK